MVDNSSVRIKYLGFRWSSLLTVVVCLVTLSTVANAQNPNIRLINGTRQDNSNGRLEVLHNNTWGTVCDDNFDNNAAMVVCRQLGYTGNLFVSQEKAAYGAGTGQIWLDDVTCTGNETNLFTCAHNAWGTNNCGHDEDVGVDCNPNADAFVNLRLVNGLNGNEGRVEVQHNGVWGTVCDDEWDQNAAMVTCKQILHRTDSSGITAIPLTGAFFGAGTGNIWLDDVKCTGLEAGLGACAHKPWGDSNCQHNEDTGVMCLGNIAPPNVTVQLTGGLSIFQGRVEIRVYDRWGTICDDGFDDKEATVICRMLGHSRGGTVITGGSYGGGSGPIWLDDLECTGNETRIQDCVHKPWGTNNCGHNEDVAVMCSQDTALNIQVRLAGSNKANQGRVEVQYNGLWGTVCDDLWSASDAAVVCRSLGLPFSGAVGLSMAAYGQGSGTILMDNVECVGTEPSLAQCKFNGWTITNCDHSEDASVICQDISTHTGVRLSGGSGPFEGRLEINYNGTWGTVCDDNFDTNAAAVVCRMLNFPTQRALQKGSAFFKPGSGQIWLDDIACNGNETDIALCGHRGWGRTNCDHNEDVSVICAGSSQRQNVTVRLSGGASSSEGRVEVFHNNAWGTVCDDDFDTKAAAVVCRMLGLPSSGAQPRPKAYYGSGNGSIWLDNVRCTGNETSIGDCNANPWGNSNCDHNEDVGVLCDTASQVRARLVNSSSTSMGRLEIFYNNTWGTVCDDGFSVINAKVVCRMLGFQETNSVPVASAAFGSGTGPILLDDVECLGSESNIVQCRNKGWYASNCEHSEDVGVICNSAATQYRLANGTRTTGRVEVNFAGQWGTVCDDQFDNHAATVVCKSLHLPYQNALVASAASYGAGTGKIWLDDVKCFGNESTLFDCNTNAPGDNDCTHAEDVGVICSDIVTSTNISYRLSDGPGPYEGRLEILYAGRWGTVCDDDFNGKAAKIVCDALGVTYVKAMVGKSGKYGPGTGPIWLDDVLCYGNESTLTQCNHNDFGVNDCDHTEDVSVVCANAAQLNLGPLRLANGTTRNGRVEVNNNGTWGTICDDGFGIAEATVVCNQIGFPGSVAVPLSSGYYGAGSGPILIDDLDCVGNETNIGQCDRKPIGVNDCDHTEDAGVMCLPHDTGTGILLRLTGGLTRQSGRVEVRYQGIWGSICDDSWDNRDAAVICRQLGMAGGTALKGIGSGTGPIWMDDVECVGTETNIANCPFKGWAENDCDHTEDAGVSCNDTTIINYNVRLMGGPSTTEGRVEVFANGQWGTVCDDQWTNADAQVVCRMLGASTDGATAYGHAKYGQGNGSIVLDQVHCVGTETNLGQCSSNPPMLHNCDHSEDAGVMCTGGQVTNLQVRLVGGSNPNEGRVEVRYNGMWGTVCDDNWNVHSAQVVCSMLQYPTQTARPRMGGFFGIGTGQIWLDDVNCLGNETSLALCGHADWGVNNCGHSEDAGVICGGATQTSPVRLANGTTRAEGRVEVFHNGTWGTICDDDTDRNFAVVICRMLGYSADNVAVRKEAFFGSGTGQIWMDDVTCQGDESVIDNCMFRPWGTNNCGHNEDVGVVCQVPTVQIRLVPPPGQSSASLGRVEVFYNNTWGTVCDDGFGATEAGVVCKMLGFSSQGAVAMGSAAYGRGSGPILLDDVHCLGQESNILQCDSKGWGINNCGHDEDVGVVCQTSSLTTVRLVGGANQFTGRVEILYNGTWGTVCDDYFTDSAAQVVCRMLGYPFAGASMVTRGGYLNPPAQIWLDNTVCTGTETTIANCQHNPWGVNNCGHSEDVGVLCSATTRPPSTTTTMVPPSTPNPSSVYIRLTGGPNAYEGRVEVYAFGQWGTVCDDDWNSTDANVVCGMVGYQSTGAAARGNANYGQGTGSIWLDNVVCHGNEQTLATCPANPWGAHNCGHQEDAGVSCATSSLPDNFLLFTDTKQRSIYRMDVGSKSYVTVPVSNNNNPIAIDYDNIDGRVYWTDVGSKQIRSASINGNLEKTVRILANNSIPDGLAVDAISRLIFYTDTGNDIIAVVTLDGSASAVIINSDLDEPRAIVVSPNQAKLYWSDWGHVPKIEMSNYDGTNRQQIINSGLTWPNAIAVDDTAGVIYWADGGTNRIEKASLDGSNRQTIHRDIQGHYFGLAMYMNTLYYTDWQQSTVMSVPTTGTVSTSVGPPGFGRLNDIHFHKNGYNPGGVNGCTNGNGACSHICLPAAGGSRKCICPTGLSLQPDGINCGNSQPCAALPAITGGTVSPASCQAGMSQPGQVCTVTCNQGYRFPGSGQVSCYGNGQWSNNGLPFVCRDVTAPTLTCPPNQVLTVPAGQQTMKATWPAIVATDNSGTNPSVFQSMQSGMTLGEGVYGVSVMATDQMGLTATCSFQVTIQVNHCSTRSPPQNGYILSGSCPDYNGASCMIACNPGYQLSDTSSNGQITCGLDSNQRPLWSGVGLSCQPVTCPQLTVPANAMLSGCAAPFSFGSICSQQCNSGLYRTQGTDTRMCMRDGTWSGQSIICSSNGGGTLAQTGGAAPSSDKGTSNIGITAAIVVGVVLIVLIIGGIFVYLKRMQMQSNMNAQQGIQLDNMSSDNRNGRSGGSSGAAGWDNPNYGEA